MKINATVSLKQCFTSNQSWWDKTQCFAVEHWTMFRFKDLFGRAGYYFFMFKTQSSACCEAASLPQRLSLDLGSHYFPLPLPRRYCFITMLDFYFLPFSRPSLWHLLAKISRLLPWNPRHGNASLGIAAAVRTDGLHQGFACLRCCFFLSLFCFCPCLARSAQERTSLVLKWIQTD